MNPKHVDQSITDDSQQVFPPQVSSVVQAIFEALYALSFLHQILSQEPHPIPSKEILIQRNNDVQ